jgi:hypothetical protein
MEYLIKHLKLDHVVKKMGVRTYLNEDIPFDENEYDQYNNNEGEITSKENFYKDGNINQNQRVQNEEKLNEEETKFEKNNLNYEQK